MTNNIDYNNNLTSATLRAKLEAYGSDPKVTLSSFPTPRRSLYLNNNAQSTTALKKQQDKLNENITQIQSTADLSALSKQQLELEKQMKKFDKTESIKVPQVLKNKLAVLEKQARVINTGLDLSNPSVLTTPAIESSSVSTTMTTVKTSRRDRNRTRNKDVEFATEIGQGLLQEVRRLQVQLHEKEEKRKELEVEKAELERNIELLNKQLCVNQESEDQLNEQVWNLELVKQELSNQLEDLQQQLVKTHNDYTKIEKALSTSSHIIEQLKDEAEILSTNLENLQIRYHKDMENNRNTIDDLKSQLESHLNASTSNNLSHKENDQVHNNDDNDSNNLNDKIETMKALEIANRMIVNLRSTIQKEKNENYKLKLLLADYQELDQFEIMNNTEFSDVVPKKQIQKIHDNSCELSDISKNDMSLNDVEGKKSIDIEGNNNNDIAEWEMV